VIGIGRRKETFDHRGNGLVIPSWMPLTEQAMDQLVYRRFSRSDESIAIFIEEVEKAAQLSSPVPHF
jgi:hypothetical protein